MDFEAPPPFVGTIEEPPDIHEEFGIRALEIEDETSEVPESLSIPCPSSPSHQRSPIPHPIIPPIKKLVENQEKEHETAEDAVEEEIPPLPTAPSKSVNCVVERQEETAPIVSTTPAEVTLPTPLQNGYANCVKVEEEPSSVLLSPPSPPPLTETPLDLDEEEDDFGDFEEAPATSTSYETAPSSSSTTNIVSSESVVPTPLQKEEEDDDDWGDFDQAPRTSRQASLAEQDSKAVDSVRRQDSIIEDDDDDWAAFSSAPAASDSKKEDSEWGADFSSAPVAVLPPAPPPETASIPPLDIMRLDELWNDEDDVEDDREPAFNITELLDSEDLKARLEGKSIHESLSRSASVWLALRVVEDALALSFLWKDASFNNNMLSVLHIDPKAVSRGSLPPLTADGVLKPTPVTANGTTRRAVVMSADGCAASFVTPSVSSGAASTTAAPAPTTIAPTPAPSVDSLSVPPADFDWDNSGLTNPLKRGATSSSILLDMDFLSANSGSSLSTVSTLQRELDELGLSSKTKPATNTSQQQSVLDALMSSSTKQIRQYRAPSELSLDARALHDQLPDIDYLRANMLMFPLGGGTGSNRPQE